MKNIKILFLLVTRKILRRNESPWANFRQLAKLSVRRMEVTRFYLQLKHDPHGRYVALFVGNLPKQDSERHYDKFLKNIIGKGWSNEKYTYRIIKICIYIYNLWDFLEVKFTIGPIYYEYTSMVIIFENLDAVRALYTL